MGIDKITLEDYLRIREEYLVRNEYLHIYEKYGSPTSFGITWAQSHVHAIAPEMKKPTKKEFKSTAKISALGILALGLLGFLVSIFMKLIIN